MIVFAVAGVANTIVVVSGVTVVGGVVPLLRVRRALMLIWLLF